ncbi:hypothetical protein [Weissella viridescens]
MLDKIKEVVETIALFLSVPAMLTELASFIIMMIDRKRKDD